MNTQSARAESMQEARNLASFSRLVDPATVGTREEFIASQRQQAKIRILINAIFLGYLWVHAPYFEAHRLWVFASVAVHIGFNLFAALVWIPRVPYSLARTMTGPLLDLYMIGMTMVVDGGHLSPTYFLLLSPALANGLRYGPRMLAFCQAGAVLTLGIVAWLTAARLGQSVDWAALAAELVATIYLPLYGYEILKKAERVAQARVRAEETAARLLFESPNPAFVFEMAEDGKTRILHANPAMASLSDLPPDQLVGRAAEGLFIEEDAPLFDEACREQLKDGERRVRRMYLRGRSIRGRPIQLMAEISSAEMEGRKLGICYLTDISESERLQAELAEAQKLGYTAALAAGIAHDFRNVLAGIMGQAELITIEHDDPALKKDAEHIITAAERGSEMVNQLLQLARGDSRELRKLHLAGPLEDMLQIARVQLPPDIRLETRLDPETPPVKANLAQLEQILLNLINNAAHAMPEGKGCIRVSLSPSQEGSGVELVVQDDGAGIPPEHLPHVFKPFWSTRKEEGGTGLGLAMVQRLIRWHGGDVRIDSEPGRGTAVILRLPEAEGDAPVPAEDTSPEHTPPPMSRESIRSCRVLLAEDHPDVERIHRAYLEQMGHEVISFPDGQAALEAVEREGEEIGLVVSDYMMPKMNGLELTRVIRRRHPDMPVIIITAYGEDEALEELSELGAVLLRKPVSYAALARAILSVQNRGPGAPG